MKRVVVCVALVVAGLISAPAASAMTLGNYALDIQGRRDFHTYVLSLISPCRNPDNSKRTDCIDAQIQPRPIAKAIYTTNEAILKDNRYTMVVEDPFGLRCGDIYYGPTVPTHDVYAWDAITLAGEIVSSFASGCNGAPGGQLTYPLFLSRM